MTTSPHPTDPSPEQGPGTAVDTAVDAGAEATGGSDGRIAPPDLARRLESDDPIRILDVRSPAEFEAAHIPGAYNVPLDTLGEHARELRNRVSGPVVLVCRSGMRASRAEQTLASVGMGDLAVLDGGMQAWDDGQRPIRRGAQRWDIERQVRLVAGSLVLVAILVSLVVPEARFLAGAVGAGLTFAALSNTCAMGNLLARLPYNRSAPTCDIGAVVAQLGAAR